MAAFILERSPWHATTVEKYLLREDIDSTHSFWGAAFCMYAMWKGVCYEVWHDLSYWLLFSRETLCVKDIFYSVWFEKTFSSLLWRETVLMWGLWKLFAHSSSRNDLQSNVKFLISLYEEVLLLLKEDGEDKYFLPHMCLFVSHTPFRSS